MTDYSLDALMQFLDYLGDKEIVNKNTVMSRKAACGKMLGILDQTEQSDLRDLDFEEVATRFGQLAGSNYTPKSLQVYKSRVGTSLSDFKRYKENPSAFKVAPNWSKKHVIRNGKRPAVIKPISSTAVLAKTEETAAKRIPSIDIPIPLRATCIVQINGLPIDLTPSEAKKISAVVSAMVSVNEE